MKNILLLLILFLNLQVFAIDWQTVNAPNGKSAELDVDSIRKYKNYYFFNIKVNNPHTNKDVVITIQSRKLGGLSERIKYYKPDEYEKLGGDYDNITANITTRLKYVEYGSVVGACFEKVKLISTKDQLQVQF